MSSLATRLVIWLGKLLPSNEPKSNLDLPKPMKENWDAHYDPNVVSYDRFRTRRRLQEKNKRVANVEEKREEDKDTGHNPWLD